jgi:hypothetical protein
MTARERRDPDGPGGSWPSPVPASCLRMSGPPSNPYRTDYPGAGSFYGRPLRLYHFLVQLPPDEPS